ncbi:MAG: type III-B CRISPR-associated protein Cas10/Cmr2 [Phormidium sp.]
MSSECYIVVTFAPVQGFIEKSRKLRDLYGSSYILSFLSWVICQAAKKRGFEVVSPALPDVTQGMPNQIILKSNSTETDQQQIQEAFHKAWGILVDNCREWIEKEVTGWDYQYWKRDWDLWKKHAWEFFWVSGEPGESITKVRERMNQEKCQRDWTGINWQWESSSLSGADAIAYPNLGRIGKPSDYNYQHEKTEIRRFYEQLSQKQGESFIKEAKLRVSPEEYEERSKKYGSSFIDPREELSIPELVKRLITHLAIVKKISAGLPQLGINVNSEGLQYIAQDLRPDSFKDLNRLKDEDSKEEKYWTCWFLGDGDNASKYFKKLRKLSSKEEENKTTEFSQQMRKWGKHLKDNQKDNQQNYLPGKGRMVYAGGDDFLGILYEDNCQISPQVCLQWFYNFKSEIWQKPQPKKISASVGFVWAGPQVPQRDVLQHCHKTEQSAKKTGRDRIAFRILFNSGNHIEWVCPWWLLDEGEFAKVSIKPENNLIESYRDRSQGKNWTHFYQDVATLKSRHAFSNDQIDIALALIEIYFGQNWQKIISDRNYWWNQYDADDMQTFTGILGDPKQFNPHYQEKPEFREALNAASKVKEAFNDWVVNLAKVGFYLTDDNGNNKKPSI